MKIKLLVGAALGATALGGINATFNTPPSGNGVPFIHPSAIAQSACGEGADGLSKSRAFFIRAANAYAQSAAAPADKRDMLWPTLGAIGYDVTTRKPEAQAWFDQGLAFTYGFNHGEAVKSFRKAQEIDPNCAMCFWGEAFALGPNINAPMFEEAVAPAFAAITKAQSLRDQASGKERALIDALAQRYHAEPTADRSALDIAFAEAMDTVALQHPDDDFIAALAAEANMDTQAWDYWSDGGRTPKGRTARTISLLESVLTRNPDHPAAIHLYIHITEASFDPYRTADHADRLAALAPGLGHLVHMPSHTYYRIGRFKQSLLHNIDAVAADEAYLAEADATILYEYGYYTHNIHFGMTSAQMAGDGKTALAMAKKLNEKLPVDMAAAAPWVQPIKAAPYYAMAQFAAP